MKPNDKQLNTEDMSLDKSLPVLTDIIARLTEKGDHSTSTPIEGLSLFRANESMKFINSVYEPGICVLAQGSKHVILGDETFVYNPHNYLLTSVHLPTIVSIINATPEKPNLGIVLKFNLNTVSQMMVDSNLPVTRDRKSQKGMVTGTVTPELLDAFVRLVKLIDDKESIPILAPIIQKEIVYRILVSDQGMRLRQIVASGSQSHQVAYAINWIRENFSEQLHIPDLAKKVNMSTSTFHHHFRLITNLTPLQFQKNLRLLEARRLMLSENMDASTASFVVGYESPSQFSREYSRMYGAPPLRDIKNLQENYAEGA